jgi:predicted dehydrogenase
VVVFDPAGEASAHESARWAGSEEEALDGCAGAVVASPSVEHLRQATLAVERGCHVLVEKPIAASAEGIPALLALAAERDRVVAVGFNLRFHPGPSGVARVVHSGAIGDPLLARFDFGSHLQDWRPGTDYRRSYSARSELGGGVLLDVIHELDYAGWLLGRAEQASAVLGNTGTLEIDVEDHVLAEVRYASGAHASFALDYLDRSYRRGCRVIGSEGSVEWSWEREEVVVVRGGEVSERIEAPRDFAPSYERQMEAWLQAADSGTGAGLGLVEGEQALHVQRLADACRRSSEARQWVAVEDAAG